LLTSSRPIQAAYLIIGVLLYHGKEFIPVIITHGNELVCIVTDFLETVLTS